MARQLMISECHSEWKIVFLSETLYPRTELSQWPPVKIIFPSGEIATWFLDSLRTLIFCAELIFEWLEHYDKLEKWRIRSRANTFVNLNPASGWRPGRTWRVCVPSWPLSVIEKQLSPVVKYPAELCILGHCKYTIGLFDAQLPKLNFRISTSTVRLSESHFEKK